MVCGIQRIAHSHPHLLNPSLLPFKNTKGDAAYTSPLLLRSRQKRANHGIGKELTCGGQASYPLRSIPYRSSIAKNGAGGPAYAGATAGKIPLRARGLRCFALEPKLSSRKLSNRPRFRIFTCSTVQMLNCSIGQRPIGAGGPDYAIASSGKILFLSVVFPDDVFKFFSRRRAVCSDLTAIYASRVTGSRHFVEISRPSACSSIRLFRSLVEPT